MLFAVTMVTGMSLQNTAFAADAGVTITVTASDGGNQISIDGYSGSAADKTVTISVIAPNGNIVTIDQISKDTELLNTEIFGPIIPIVKYSDYEEVIEEANSLSYGLASYVYTEDEKIKNKMANDIEAGGVSINSTAPMHVDIAYGGFKESGIGYEGGQEAIDSYIHKKNINIIE